MKEKQEKRFWSKVDKRGPDDCWPWKASRNPDGYGKFSIDDVDIRAHRVAYFLVNGEFDRSLNVLHRCDNPPCVNPAHLFTGSVADNMADKVSKGRSSAMPGESHPLAALSDKKIHKIRRLYNEIGLRQKRIAILFGVSQSAVSRVVSGQRWGHV